jgi:hypothetical protein
MNEILLALWAMKWHLLALTVLTAVVCAVAEHFDRCDAEPEPAPPSGVPEFMYVDLPDGTMIRGRCTPHPIHGFPTTPPLSEWEVVE